MMNHFVIQVKIVSTHVVHCDKKCFNASIKVKAPNFGNKSNFYVFFVRNRKIGQSSKKSDVILLDFPRKRACTLLPEIFDKIRNATTSETIVYVPYQFI